MRSPFVFADKSSFALLHALRRAGLTAAVLAPSLPRLAPPIFQRWLGPCAALWPIGVPAGTRWSVVSSRLPRALDAQPEWFESLRDVCFDATVRRAALLSVSGTAGAPHVRHAARTLHLRSIEVHVASDEYGDDVDPTTFARDVVRHLELLPASAVPLWLIPCTHAASPSRSVVCPDAALRDRAAVLLGDLVRPLRVRRGGVLERLLRARSDERLPANAWPHRVLPSASVLRPPPRRRQHPASPVSDAGPAPLQLPWPALVHCTRRCDGPWPDQTEDEYHSELLWGLDERDRSPLAALRRILFEARLRASATALRGGRRMVCFTSRPLARLSAFRCYRRHRRRWDFEPYGLAIRQDWLAARGARPVIYGDEADWRTLPPASQPWFQPRGNSIDWQMEQEWRIAGDVDLAQLDSHDAFLFVKSPLEAYALQPFSRWRVVSLDA